MTTQHEDDSRRGGLRGAVDELFGRGERTDDRAEGEHRDDTVRDDTVRDDSVRDDSVRDDTVRDDSLRGDTRPDGAYADDPALDREPGMATQAQYGDSQSQYAGDPAPESARQQTSYGDEVRGDTVTSDQVQRGGDPTAAGQYQHGGEVRGDTDLAADSRYDDAGVSGGVRSDSAAGTGYADEEQLPPTDAPVGRADAGQTVSDPARTDAGAHDTAATGGTGQAAGASADMAAAHDTDEDGNAALVSADRAESYGSRWNSVKGEFVDEPRRAVADADALVGELLDELQELFKAQRSDIERGLDADETSTEDLRLALRRYRSFFDRLLSI
jgi:hypothetical protein